MKPSNFEGEDIVRLVWKRNREHKESFSDDTESAERWLEMKYGRLWKVCGKYMYLTYVYIIKK